MVIVNVGEEGAVVIGECLPVHAVHILAVEASFLFTDDFLKHDLALLDAIYASRATEGNGLEGICLRIQRLRLCSEEEELCPLLVTSEEGSREVELLLQLGGLFAHIMHPEVVACFCGREEVELLPICR